MNNGVANLMAWADVNEMDLFAVKIQLITSVEQRRGRNQFDTVKVIDFQQLLPGGRQTWMETLENQTRQKSADTMQQLLTFIRLGHLLHSLRH